MATMLKEKIPDESEKILQKIWKIEEKQNNRQTFVESVKSGRPHKKERPSLREKVLKNPRGTKKRKVLGVKTVVVAIK